MHVHKCAHTHTAYTAPSPYVRAIRTLHIHTHTLHIPRTHHIHTSHMCAYITHTSTKYAHTHTHTPHVYAHHTSYFSPILHFIKLASCHLFGLCFNITSRERTSLIAMQICSPLAFPLFSVTALHSAFFFFYVTHCSYIFIHMFFISHIRP